MPDIKAVTITRSGGVGGMIRRYQLDATALTVPQQKEMVRLTQSLTKSGGPTHPDAFTYEVRIEMAAGDSVLNISESGAGSALQSLLELCKGQKQP